jgi:acetyl esterase/lipase
MFGPRFAVRLLFSLAIVTLTGCSRGGCKRETRSLKEARKELHSVPIERNHPRTPAPVPPWQSVIRLRGQPAPAPPPAGSLKLVDYPSEVGRLLAYVSIPPSEEKKHPAIIWIHGGDCNSLSEKWEPDDPKNAQNASVFRESGVITMFPALRGGNNSESKREGFLGEANDIEAALNYLEAQPFVDPKRVFLGGHSTGGTLAMLVAESTSRFRAVFAFGPVGDFADYGNDFRDFQRSDEEFYVRSPEYWLSEIGSPTYVIEGDSRTSNIRSLRTMRRKSKNPVIHFVEGKGYDHFDILSPYNTVISRAILNDSGVGEFAPDLHDQLEKL